MIQIVSFSFVIISHSSLSYSFSPSQPATYGLSVAVGGALILSLRSLQPSFRHPCPQPHPPHVVSPPWMPPALDSLWWLATDRRCFVFVLSSAISLPIASCKCNSTSSTFKCLIGLIVILMDGNGNQPSNSGFGVRVTNFPIPSISRSRFHCSLSLVSLTDRGNLLPMATQSYLLSLNSFHLHVPLRGWQCQPLLFKPSNFGSAFRKSLHYPTKRNDTGNSRVMQCCSCYKQVGASAGLTMLSLLDATTQNSLNSDVYSNTLNLGISETSQASTDFMTRLVVADIDPATAKLAIGFLGPFLSVFGFLFILRIVMSWYPKLPVGKFPYVIAYAPTEPLLIVTRKVIPPLAGVDVTPVVWFGLVSFLNEILVGPQGLLVLLSQQVN
ncbi:hypothetical protein RJT34_15386 [Clitoria ternatea]|uniref:Protein COFACTOR ASSEMBLY OF COMPLEX C SUBUNIT B CCB3, chloroplastic n=1 Tax=Clitoria ternatea TaxID=43366 RepID=A0AAN9PBD5_CLITE